MSPSIAEPEPITTDPAYFLLDRIHEAMAIAIAEGLPTGTAMRAVLLVTDHNMPPAEAVEASECWGYDDRVKAAGTKRNALVADALRATRAREYGEDVAS